MVKIYGIKNCDTVRKSLIWLKQHNIEYQLHNYKTDGVTPAVLQDLLAVLSWKIVLNMKSTTWRKLDQSIRDKTTNEEEAKKIMMEYPSIIKRPILIRNNKALAGFSADLYQQFFKE